MKKIFLIAIIFVMILQVVQKPTSEQIEQSINQGQHQSEANYWRAN